MTGVMRYGSSLSSPETAVSGQSAARTFPGFVLRNNTGGVIFLDRDRALL